MNRSALLNRIRQRAGARGAAMVEGAFMAIIFALFFNCMVWCAGLYLSKIQATELSRYETFYYATHNCEGTPPNYKNLDFQKANGGGLSKSQGDEGDNPNNLPSAGKDGPANGDFGGGTDRSGFFAKGTARLNFTWSWNKKPGWWDNPSGTGTVISESYVMCNEKKYGINVLSFIFKFVQQAWGQISSLF